METEGEVQAVSKGAASGLNISLHPLVIINISDHTTRKRSLNNNKPTRALGVLLGVQVRASLPFLRCPSLTHVKHLTPGARQPNSQWRAKPRGVRAHLVILPAHRCR